ncbi:hypothetical protein EYF80_027919 [Liparis tanakae]|uniref:Uncharacterized protein n=1 Tax=Liparis tanakae TaxID=230148 RepID=A0A4Z2HA65_9TELE|nr:hypothetical protein EYF80_027919 [Liparis tanakae]
MSGPVGLKVILWTAPIFSRRTRAPCCSGSPFRLHTGALRTGPETSHSKRASSGATTSTSSSSLTIDRGRAGGGSTGQETGVNRQHLVTSLSICTPLAEHEYSPTCTLYVPSSSSTTCWRISFR